MKLTQKKELKIISPKKLEIINIEENDKTKAPILSDSNLEIIATQNKHKFMDGNADKNRNGTKEQMVMINVYSPEETAFANNGLKILKPLKALIRKEDNGTYYLDLKDTLENLDYYQSGNIVRVQTPWGLQCFRIKNVSIENKRVSVRAYHLYFDAENYIISDSYVVDKNANDALDHLNSATDVPSPFSTLSDITSVNSYRCVRKSFAEAVNDVIDRWGGHLVRNNWNIEVRQTIGQDRGVVLSYGKNIVNITADENWNDVVTKLMPVGKDGLLLPEIWLTISEALYFMKFHTPKLFLLTRAQSFQRILKIPRGMLTKALTTRF